MYIFFLLSEFFKHQKEKIGYQITTHNTGGAFVVKLPEVLMA
jgi:hypothetical protein